MSLNKNKELRRIAKNTSRDLRKRSTESEKIFWNYVRDRKFCNRKFYRQYPIFYDLTGKESFFVADFYCHEEKLIIELDGPIHNYKLAEDKTRTKILNLLGLKSLRFKNKEIEESIEIVLERIKREFKQTHPLSPLLLLREGVGG